MNLSFAGCGFLGLYHTGVVCCIQKYAPQLILNRVSGASAGAMAACALLCDQPLDAMVSQGLKIAKEAREGPLGPFSPSFDLNKILIDGLRDFLPEDAHIRVNGKLHVSLTRVKDGKNVLISQFDSKEDLIQAVVASTFIPIFSGFIPPKFKGVRYIDGGFSNNSPIIDEHTITVSPFCGESDICPKDNSYQLYHITFNNSSIELSRDNICRFKSVLFPPKPEILSQLCKEGFEDTLKFLYQKSLLNCSRCLEVQSTFTVETKEEADDCDPECSECKTYQMEVLTSDMPDHVSDVFQDYIERTNDGISNWVNTPSGLKILTLPYTIPVDIISATVSKLVTAIPFVGDSLWQLSRTLMGQVLSFISSENQTLPTTVSMKVSVAEYDSRGNARKISLKDARRNSKMDLNFRVNLEKNDIPKAEDRRRRFSAANVLNRRASVVFDHPGDSDTFEHILDVTTHHNALMRYYYMDENNKMNVTEIFGIEETEGNTDQMPSEEHVNFQHNFNSKIKHRHEFKRSNTVGGFKNFIDENEEQLLQEDATPESDRPGINIA